MHAQMKTVWEVVPSSSCSIGITACYVHQKDEEHLTYGIKGRRASSAGSSLLARGFSDAADCASAQHNADVWVVMCAWGSVW